MKKLIICLMFLLVASVVESADWKSYATSGDGAKHYYDTTSVTNVSKDIVRCWQKTERHKGVAQGDYKLAISVKKSLAEINCTKKEYRVITVIAEGYSTNTPSPWRLIPPDSIVEDLYKTICTGDTTDIVTY